MATNTSRPQTAGSWVQSANQPGIDFPIENLPYGAFRRAGSSEAFRIGVAIGDQILDCAAVYQALTGSKTSEGLIAQAGNAAMIERFLEPLARGDLNAMMAMGPATHHEARTFFTRVLAADASPRLESCLVPQKLAEMAVPCRIGDYTDFYASIHHATAVGKMFRPDAPLLPNYKWVPIGYHGRSSSIGVSGQRVIRPKGQLKAAAESSPVYAPSQRLDIELEVGAFIGAGNALGSPISIAQAESHLFGLCILNDWSARDIQAWEYQPLGPFLAKNFASTISPWIVTMQALAPFREPFTRPAQDPQPLGYLDCDTNRSQGAINITLELWIQSAAMARSGQAPQRIASSNLRYAYWTFAQMVTHHSCNGCNLSPGDLLGSGTMSGPAHEEAGSLLELTRGGQQLLTLSSGEQRSFLEDGDTVIMKAYCESECAVRIGLGECVGTIVGSTVGSTVGQ